MAKRFTETTIWDEDWFISMPNEYKLFWFYVKDKCCHAGIFKVNISLFNYLIKSNIKLEKALEYFNEDKQRIRILKKLKWFIEDFISFQYGKVLNKNNNMHNSVLKIIENNDIQIDTIRGLREVKETSKRGQREGTPAPKEKEQDKDKEIYINNITERQNNFKLEVESFICKEWNEKMCTDFYAYWSEPNKTKTKMRYELQKTWDTERRLRTWHNRSKLDKFNPKNVNTAWNR